MEYSNDNKINQPNDEMGNQEQNFPGMPPKNSTRNLKIIIGVLVVLLVAAASVAGFYIFGNKNISEKEQLTPVSDQNIVPSTQDNQIIQKSDKAPLIVYAYKQFSTSVTKIYQSDISGQSKSEVNIGYAEGVRFMATKDGKYLARWDNNKLEIAPAKGLNSFKKIAETLEPNTRLNNVVWSVDGTKLVYIISKDLKPNEPFSPSEKRLYVINRDGSGQKLVKQFQRPDYVALEGFNSPKNELYWFETGEGGFVGNFTVINLADGSVKETKKDLDPGLDFSLNFTSDFSKAYYIKDYKIYEYTLSNNNKRILYELDNVGQDKYGNRSNIDRLKLSPKDNLLVFTRRTEPDDKEITFSIALPSGKVEILLDDAKYYNIGPFTWSPEGKYLWFETWCHGCGQETGYNNEGEYYIMDMETKNISLFFKGSKGEYEKTGQGVRINETLNFISWITE